MGQVNDAVLQRLVVALFASVLFLLPLGSRGVVRRVLGRHGSTQCLVVAGNWDIDQLKADARRHARKACGSLSAVPRMIVRPLIVEQEMNRDSLGQVLDLMPSCVPRLYEYAAVGASFVEI